MFNKNMPDITGYINMKRKLYLQMFKWCKKEPNNFFQEKKKEKI